MSGDAHRTPDLPEDLTTGEIEEMVLVPGNHTVLGPPPPPLSREVLFDTIRLLYPEPDASEFAEDLSEDLGVPGVIWSSNILLLSALHSKEQWERMRDFLKLSPEQMQEAVAEAKLQIKYPRG